MTARKEYIGMKSVEAEIGEDDADGVLGRDEVSVCSDAGTGLSQIADKAMDDAISATKGSSKPRKLCWETEYLVYCLYARCNISMRRIAAIFGIVSTFVHNIVYAWANVLCNALEKFSQFLRGDRCCVLTPRV